MLRPGELRHPSEGGSPLRAANGTFYLRSLSLRLAGGRGAWGAGRPGPVATGGWCWPDGEDEGAPQPRKKTQ
jgi:hypothetical protein